MYLKSNSPLQRSFLLFFYSLFLFYILSSPFEFNLLQFNLLKPLFESFIKFIGPFILNNSNSYTLHFHADSTGLYLNIAFISLLSLINAFLIEFFIKSPLNSKRVLRLCSNIILYYLALHLFIYGFNKLFKFQFFDPSPNTMFTPVGQLGKDILYWSSMGSSLLYNRVTGFSEVLVAIVLFSNRFRLVGAAVASLILAHVLLINFAFDINVKLHSFFLLLMAVTFLLDSNNQTRPQLKDDITPKKRIAEDIKKSRSLSILLLAYCLLESLIPYIESNCFNGDLAVKTPYYGAYEITQPSNYKRFFFHQDSYFILQGKNDNFYSFPLDLDSSSIFIYLKEDTAQLHLQQDKSILQLKGDLFGEAVDFKGYKIDIDSMPLMDDSFKWTTDGYN